MRNSRQVGNFALSVCLPVGMQPSTQHYLIVKNSAGWRSELGEVACPCLTNCWLLLGLCFDQAERYFSDLESLVAHYVCNMR